jgi:hypothetical protein
LAHVVHGHDRRVLDLPARARFQEEAVQRLAVLGELGEQELDREVAIRQLVARSPDRSHPAPTELSEQAILP